MTQPTFPATRMRRLRRHDWSRRLVAEATLSPADFIWPLFVIDGENRRAPVAAMPGVERLSVDLAVEAAEEAAGLGIPVIALFPQPHWVRLKSPRCRARYFALPMTQCRGLRQGREGLRA